MEETVLEVAARRANALARRDWETVAAQLHPQFLYVNASGDRLDREAYLGFLHDGPMRWNRQTIEAAEVVETGPVAVPSRDRRGRRRLERRAGEMDVRHDTDIRERP